MATDLAGAVDEYRAAQQAIADAKDQLRASQERLRTARGDLAEHVVAEYRGGTRVRDLTESTGMSREWVRLTLRAAGVDEPDWPDWHRD